MVAFNTLYKLKNQVQTEVDKNGLYVVCASNGKNHAMMISNLTGERVDLEFEGVDLSEARWHVIDNERLLSWSPQIKRLETNDVVLIEW
jgi:hypothetical protein